MDVSIAMATYNGAPYLPAQLESLAAQTVKPAELVVCDDGSSDATADVVRNFARTAPFPVILHTNSHRLHFADNFLKAARLCSSEYVAFCDQDDLWRPRKLAAVTRAAELSGACLVAHNAAKIDAGGRLLGELSHTGADGMLTGADLHPWRFFFGFTCTFRRQLLTMIPSEHRPFDLIDPTRRMAHDRWVAFLASIYGDVYVLSDQLVNYRYHDANASGWMQTRRSLAESLDAARHKFGYNVLKQLLVAQSLIRLMGSLLSNQSRLAALPSPRPLLEMLAYWTVFEERCAARYSITQQDNRDLRARRLGHALVNDAYRNAVDGSICFRTLVQDLLVSLVARPGQREYAEALLSSTPRSVVAA
jgi:glycosyltransferase involved in cell wall biosynthesis